MDQHDRVEKRFRTGGVCFILVGILSAFYAMHLHADPTVIGKSPGYGLAITYILDWIGRSMDQVGGIFGYGWEERAYRLNLIIAGIIAGIGGLSWLGSRVNKLFSVVRILPQLGSRLVYMAGLFFYLLDTLLAVCLEVGVRRMYHVDWFALQCLIIHGCVLVVLAYGFSTGLFGLYLGLKEFLSFLRHPLQTLRGKSAEKSPQ